MQTTYPHKYHTDKFFTSGHIKSLSNDYQSINTLIKSTNQRNKKLLALSHGQFLSPFGTWEVCICCFLATSWAQISSEPVISLQLKNLLLLHFLSDIKRNIVFSRNQSYQLMVPLWNWVTWSLHREQLPQRDTQTHGRLCVSKKQTFVLVSLRFRGCL